ncbi:hypothetical protein A2Z22_03040 [Candidatus Woesebacteria bacterium RBG_16_34_12]|uniref:Nudix hydrolase domain-containing protein n=1 Tax=Candidatus Woesebacteria bacterium RBG_16_34_12 TaxID=1802480 RepID=A0A1F7X6Y1_9BACT|nr:MAG: hypothetical protein A2Z22_03040 [Candidatus Woesebacteria bacterium RBG_16_34_12]
MVSSNHEIITKEIPEKHDVIFAIIRNGVIHLEERTEPGTTYFGYTIIPGGGVEEGEILDQALLREIREERGVIPTEYREIGIVDSVESNGRLNFRHIYLVTDYQGEITNAEGKNRQFWASLEEAEKLCEHPISKNILILVRDALSVEEDLKD